MGMDYDADASRVSERTAPQESDFVLEETPLSVARRAYARSWRGRFEAARDRLSLARGGARWRRQVLIRRTQKRMSAAFRNVVPPPATRPDGVNALGAVVAHPQAGRGVVIGGWDGEGHSRLAYTVVRLPTGVRRLRTQELLPPAPNARWNRSLRLRRR